MPPSVRRLVALVACSTAIVLAPGRVLAHTELDFSLPANGTTVGEPVEEISVGFTDQVGLVGNGFEVHDPQGNLLTPFVATDDNMVFKMQFDPPLGGGTVVVDYHVRALDGDEQQGSFSFTAAAPAPTVPPATVPATSAAPVTTSPVAAPTTADATTTTSRAATTTAPVTTASGSTSVPALATEDSESDDGNERTVMFAVLLGIAAVAAAFLVLRSRRTA